MYVLKKCHTFNFLYNIRILKIAKINRQMVKYEFTQKFTMLAISKILTIIINFPIKKLIK